MKNLLQNTRNFVLRSNKTPQSIGSSASQSAITPTPIRDESHMALPDDILLEIFSHLDPLTLSTVKIVCRYFRNLCTMSSVWRDSLLYLCSEQPQCLPLLEALPDSKRPAEVEQFARRMCRLTTQIWPSVGLRSTTRTEPIVETKTFHHEYIPTSSLILPGGRWMLIYRVEPNHRKGGRTFYVDLNARAIKGRSTRRFGHQQSREGRDSPVQHPLLDRLPNYDNYSFERMHAREVKGTNFKEFDVSTTYMHFTGDASVFVTVDRVVVSDDGLQLKRTAINKFEIPGRPLRKDNLEGDFYVRDNCDEVRIVRWTTSSMEQMDYTSFKPNTSDRDVDGVIRASRLHPASHRVLLLFSDRFELHTIPAFTRMDFDGSKMFRVPFQRAQWKCPCSSLTWINPTDRLWILSAAPSSEYLTFSTVSEVYVVRLPYSSSEDPEVHLLDIPRDGEAEFFSTVFCGGCHGVRLMEGREAPFHLGLLSIVPPFLNAETGRWGVIEKQLALPVAHKPRWLTYDDVSGRIALTLEMTQQVDVLYLS